MKHFSCLIVFCVVLLSRFEENEARKDEDDAAYSQPKPRIGENANIDPKYDFVVYLFMEDSSYYSGVLISENVVATYQTLMIYEPKICFNEDCVDDVKKTWSTGNYQFWRLGKKRGKPSLYNGNIDEDDCYLPPELGLQGYVEFDLMGDAIQCSASCMSGDAIICGSDLYGMLAKVRNEDLDQFEFVSVSKLQSLAGIAAGRKKPQKESDEEEDDPIPDITPSNKKENNDSVMVRTSNASSRISLLYIYIGFLFNVLMYCSYYR